MDSDEVGRGAAGRARGRRPAKGRSRKPSRTFHWTRSRVPNPVEALVVAVPILCALMFGLPVGVSKVAAQSPHTENTLRLDPGADSPPARIDDFAFLEGHWVGEGLDGQVDEFWSRPAAGTILGAFRLIREGRVEFYELFALEEEGGSAVLRLKHFNPGPGLHGWEERDEDFTFHLVRVAPGTAWFNGLTYRLVEPDTLVVHLALRSGEGAVREEVFRFHRAPR